MLKSDFDVPLNKCNESQGSIFYVWMFSCNTLISLAVPTPNVIFRVSTTIEHPTYLATLTSVHSITISICRKICVSNNMIAMQKICRNLLLLSLKNVDISICKQIKVVNILQKLVESVPKAYHKHQRDKHILTNNKITVDQPS